MSQLIYLDFLRRVSPIQNVNDETKPEFMLLGSFDALRVKFEACNLQTIKRLHETGHETVASIYDRQPMYLFDYGGSHESPQSIFSARDDFAHLPIIISILQINKTEYAKTENASVSDLIDRARAIVKEKIQLLEENEQGELVHWSVFWNFGEPDIVIVFRPKHLAPVVKVLHRIRVDLDSKIQVFSSCSHCGFPYQNDIEETKRALNEWVQHETDSGKVKYYSFVNTSSGYHRLQTSGQFVFGEWDYIIVQDLKNGLADNLLQTEEYTKNPPYKTSYTLPAIEINDLGEAKGQQLSDDMNWVENIKDSFNNLIASVKDMPYLDDNSIELIRSLSYTLIGLAKYLIRLFLGRYEQDLYTYTKPIFVALPIIIKSYQEQIEALHHLKTFEESNKGEIICRLVMEIEEDTTNLISGLQHLFSVLSISPHTFMETFGSNMRSLSAANKLVDAYQGFISFLGRYFPDVIDQKTIGQHQILIIPYRESYPKHTLFYHSSSPLVRISKIEMDFPKMFRLGPSVFIILHECAHHLGNRLRLERWQLYFKACVYLAAESIVSKFLIDPLSALISPTSTESIQVDKAPLFFGMEEDQKIEAFRLFGDSIYLVAKDAIISIGDKLYNMLEVHAKELGEDLAPYYSSYFRDQLYNSYTLNLVEDLFNKLFPNSTYGANERIRSELLKAINTDWIPPMRKLARTLADFVIENGGNQYEASLLLAKYKSGNIATGIVNYFPSMIRQKILMGGFIDLQNVFSDVYADIFAIQILCISSFEKYCEMIQQFTGTAVNEAILNSKNLQRIAVVGKTCFDLEVIRNQEGLNELINANNITVEWKRNEIRNEWRKATGTSYFECICNYAKECKEKMEEQLTLLKSKEDVKKYLTIINNTFNKDDIDTETSFIETFWRFLMEERECQ